jgi:hypothetical protein
VGIEPDSSAVQPIAIAIWNDLSRLHDAVYKIPKAFFDIAGCLRKLTLTTCSRILLEKLTVAQSVRKFRALMEPEGS